MNKGWFFDTLLFFSLLILQAIVFKHIVLFKIGLCFSYTAFILLMPIGVSSFALLLLGFLLGILVDIFYDSAGLHAAALVLLAFMRNAWIAIVYPPQSIHAKDSRPSTALGGAPLFTLYAFPLIFIQHVVLFFTELGGFSMAGYTLLKALTSALLTFIATLILQYLVPRQKRL